MARLQTKSIGEPDERRSFPNGQLEIYSLDDVVIGRTLFEPGWHWADRRQAHRRDTARASTTTSACASAVASRSGWTTASTMEVGPGTVFDIPPGHDGRVIGDEPWETYDFAGMRAFGRTIDPDDRILASILFTDVVDSTATAERMGDTRWRETISTLNEACQAEVDRLRGRIIKKTGDGILALFDSSERAVRAAAGVRRPGTSARARAACGGTHWRGRTVTRRCPRAGRSRRVADHGPGGRRRGLRVGHHVRVDRRFEPRLRGPR